MGHLADLSPGRTKAVNALWIENPLSARFNSTNRVVVADLQGPAEITMIHFAMPATLKLDRSVSLRIFWDGERAPSVDCPLVDFFCDPAGVRESVNTTLVNKRRGFNAYFPMPFRKSERGGRATRTEALRRGERKRREGGRPRTGGLNTIGQGFLTCPRIGDR